MDLASAAPISLPPITVPCPVGDGDGDGVPDAADPDDDNDGVPDTLELGGMDLSGDRDGDRIPDYRDPDFVTCTAVAGACVMLPASVDPDGDGIPSHLDLDADGDGLPDVFESGNGALDANDDGLPDDLADTDGDGLINRVDAGPADPTNTTATTPAPDFDMDGRRDFLDVDSDADGITDTAEALGRDANGDGRIDLVADLNGNGLSDSVEGAPLAKPNSGGSARIDVLDTDSDGDGVADRIEGHDADFDGVADRSPAGRDTDSDGLDDAYDPDCTAARCMGVVGRRASLQNRDADSLPDYRDADDDGDGIPTTLEGTGDLDGSGGPNYLDTESDGDGIFDATECPMIVMGRCRDTDMDTRMDFLDVDDDGDGIPTLVEGTVDTDMNGGANYVDTDSDGDGVPDLTEGHDANRDGRPDRMPAGRDSDSDGLDDAFDPDCTAALCMGVVGVAAPLPDSDATGGADYVDVDDDGDGIDTRIECPALPCRDTDTDMMPDYLDLDSDADGVRDQREGTADPDGDGRGAWIDVDSDGDGVLDAIEGHDVDGNGVADLTPRGMDSGPRDGLDDAFTSAPPPPNHDTDAVPDILDVDDDGDGIPTATELPRGDSDMDGRPDYLDPDDDNDGIPTSVECTTPGACENTDMAGEPDYLDLDSDGDSLLDRDECPSQPCVDRDMDGAPDFRDTDDDGDGIPTATEIADQRIHGTPDGDTTDAWYDDDSDGDGAPDASEGRLDFDMDGVPDYLDPDSTPVDTDMDGIPDTLECGGPPTPACRDTDGDGLPDYMDPDDDNDGVNTREECLTPTACEDTDMDGRPDHLDVDDDGDGIPTLSEGPLDFDGDGDPDYRDADDDGDGIPTAIEAFDADADGVADVTPRGVDSNMDGLDDAYDPALGGMAATEPDLDMRGGPDYLDIDADDDGIEDAVECDAARCPDTDMDGTPDYLDLDTDGDGVPDSTEGHDADADGTADVVASGRDFDLDGLDDAFDADCTVALCGVAGVAAPLPDRDMIAPPDWRDRDDDGDGILTATEIADTALHGDPETDGIPPYLDSDSDDDGSPDITEGRLDLDMDGVPDYLDPDSVVIDTDMDTIPDVIECMDTTMPAMCPDTDRDGIPDFEDPDDDGDGVLTRDERPEGDQDTDRDGTLDHLDVDDDGDGIPTADELGPGGATAPRDFDMDGRPDYLDPDDDDDGIPTLTERRDSMGPGNDVNGNGSPNWLDTDADGDGISDMMECPDAAAGCPDGDMDGVPDYLDADSSPLDTDGDGLPDSVECPTMPCVDTDGDGRPDFDDDDDDNDSIPTRDELSGGMPQDSDGDGRPNHLDPDDDGDGILTRTEREDGAALPGGGDDDVDDDGIPNWLDTDSDGDGIDDADEGREDEDGDGIPNYLDPNVLTDGLSGGALCSANAPGGQRGAPLTLLLLLAGVLALRARRRLAPVALAAAMFLALLGGASAARAQDGGFNIDQFRAAETGRDGFAISSPNDLGHLDFAAQLTLDYALNPLVHEVRAGDGTTEDYSVIEHHLVGNVGLALGLVDRLVIYGGIPVVLLSDGADGMAFQADGTSMGDPQLGLRGRLFGERDDAFALGIQAAVSFPLANATQGGPTYGGDRSVVFLPRIMGEIRAGDRVRIDLNVGGRFREATTVRQSLVVGHELTFGAGAIFTAVPDVFDILLEVYGSTGFERFFERNETAVEAILGGRVMPTCGLSVGLAGGTGLARGYGAPDFRGVLQVAYAHEPRCDGAQPEEQIEPTPEPDTDDDGIVDSLDECPTEPEDVDTWQDEDGCPDPDNDSDGVLDVDDGAPLEPEDPDQWQDEDGVPDPDNDGDGVPDVSDGAPNDPEDADGFQDADGVPDPDNDHDTVLDADDQCPLDPGRPADHGCPRAVRVDRETGTIYILQLVEFATNRDVILARSFPVLQEVAAVLEANPEIQLVRIEGHTDDRGRDDRNLDLSVRRARSVRRWLIEHGIATARLEAWGCGEMHPREPNTTADGRQANRRVEFHILSPVPAAGARALDGCVRASE